MQVPRPIASFPLIVLMALLPACAHDASPAAPGSPSTGGGTGALEGVTWVLSDASMSALAAGAPADARVDLTFEGERVHGSAACNSYSGGLRLAGTALSFEAFATTQMACAPPLMELETAYLGAMADVTGYSVDGSTLTLTGGPTDLTFDAEIPAPPLALTGTSWRLESIVSGDSVSSTIAGTEATLILSDGGTASGNATCNQLSGTYETSGESLTFGPLATTKMACTVDGASEQEHQVLTALAATRSFAIDGDQLTLSDESGAALLTYRGA